MKALLFLSLILLAILCSNCKSKQQKSVDKMLLVIEFRIDSSFINPLNFTDSLHLKTIKRFHEQNKHQKIGTKY
jgi:hypothetical protein